MTSIRSFESLCANVQRGAMRRRAFFFFFLRIYNTLTHLLLTGPPNFSVFSSIFYYGQYFKVIELCVHNAAPNSETLTN